MPWIIIGWVSGWRAAAGGSVYPGTREAGSNDRVTTSVEKQPRWRVVLHLRVLGTVPGEYPEYPDPQRGGFLTEAMKCRARCLTHRYQQHFRLNWSVTVTLALHSPTHQTPLFDPRRLQCAAVDTLDINNADGSQGVMSYSLIEQCGDFQMARREMWQRATFSQSMTGRRLVALRPKAYYAGGGGSSSS